MRRLLAEHRLGDMARVAELALCELLGCAHRFTPGSGVNVSVRWRYEQLRLTVFDRHPVHPEPEDAGLCRARRLGTLALLSAVVRACDGSWGVTDAAAPLGGTRLWAALPREGVRRYGEA